MEDNKITNCNQCPNQCPADDLKCGRGRHYFEQLENPDAARADGECQSRHGHGEGHGESQGRHDHEGRHGRPDDLQGLLRACGHYLHHGGKPGQLFAVLDEGEQESLRALLKKLVEGMER